MEEFPAYSVDAPELSTRGILKDSGIEPLLAEMLLCPTCYYGSARHDDIDFPTYGHNDPMNMDMLSNSGDLFTYKFPKFTSLY